MSYRNNDAEGGTNGVTVGIGDAGSGAGFDNVILVGSATAKYSTTQNMHGRQSYNVTSTLATDQAVLSYQNINDFNCAARFYVYLNALPGAAIQLMNVRGAGGIIATMNLTATFHIQVLDSASTSLGSTTATLSASTWYRVEVWFTSGSTTAGACNFIFYVGDSLTPATTVVTSTTSNFTTNTMTEMRFGKLSSTGAGVSLYYDDIGLTSGTTTFLGPAIQSPVAWFTA